MTLITNTHELEQTCQRFMAHPFVTVDTEFVREKTFWPEACVIQMASPNEAVAIDLFCEHLNLSPFFDLMRAPNVTKVFHAARQDLEIIWNMAQFIPAPLFDTQIAAMALGYGEQVAYGDLVKSICNVIIDKSLRFSDWTHRPLSKAHLDYALSDVTWLRDIYLHLTQQLTERNRESWVQEEMDSLREPDKYIQPPENAWHRLYSRVRGKRDIYVLREVAKWREIEAQKKNIPRGHLLKDDALMDIVLAAPKTIEALGHIRSLHKGIAQGHTGKAILAAVLEGLAQVGKPLPPMPTTARDPRGRRADKSVIDLLRVLLLHVSEQESVAPKMIASVEDLELLAQDPLADIPPLKGWRREVFGNQAADLVQGKIALSLADGKLTTITV